MPSWDLAVPSQPHLGPLGQELHFSSVLPESRPRRACPQLCHWRSGDRLLLGPAQRAVLSFPPTSSLYRREQPTLSQAMWRCGGGSLNGQDKNQDTGKLASGSEHGWDGAKHSDETHQTWEGISCDEGAVGTALGTTHGYTPSGSCCCLQTPWDTAGFSHSISKTQGRRYI